MAKQTIGNNVDVEIEGNIMTITVDLSKDFGPSTSGKTQVIATTSGSRTIPTPVGNIMVGININRKK